MAHNQQIAFCNGVKAEFPQMFTGVSVLDIGSLDINGSNRYLFTDYSYVGVDLGPGKNVDVVCSGHEYSGPIVDVAISTECFEHNKEWAATFTNMCKHVKPGGLVLFTCATEGRREHGTARTSPKDSPFTTDYYRNLTEADFHEACDIDLMFSLYEFSVNKTSRDLYFYGVRSDYSI